MDECDICKEPFDHVSVTRKAVVRRHKCHEWVELWPGKFAPCALPTHDGPCLGEMVKPKRNDIDYGGLSNESYRQDQPLASPRESRGVDGKHPCFGYFVEREGIGSEGRSSGEEGSEACKTSRKDGTVDAQVPQDDVQVQLGMRVYTDGGYRQSVGSWAWYHPLSKNSDSGIALNTSNQRMELQAAAEAMDTYLDEPDLIIVSDSAYLVNAINEGYLKRWEANGWVTSKNEAVSNQDLWMRISAFLKENPDIRFEKVKGHSGDPGNDAADALATKTINEYLAMTEEQLTKDREALSPNNKLPPTPFVLKPHQEEAVEKLINGSVLNGGVGTGKTFTALAYYVLKACEGSLDRSKPMGKPKKLIVITTAKKRNDLDWEKEAMHLGLFPDPELSYSGKELIVDSWNNMHKYEDETNAFFIFDEQKLVGKGAWVKTFLKITKTNQWILLSATPADNWIDYVPLFLAHGFFRTRSQFMDEHVIWKMVNGRYPKIKGYYGEKKLRSLRDSILVDMPYDRHTTRHLVAVPVEHDKELFDLVWKKRWNVYENQPLEDSGEMHRVGRKVVNSDIDRIKKIAELGEKHDRMIVFYNFDYELDLLRTLHTEMDIKVAEWNGHRHEPVPDDDRWVYLVQYQAGAEGWNCTTTNVIVFYSLTYSHKVFEQAQGRTDRLDTPFTDLLYYILMSNSKIDKLIWRSVIAKKNFHEGRKVRFDRAA